MFTLIVAVHEFGHYFTARLLGMRVLEFAFGFRPRLFATGGGGIEYNVNAIPFGGFVRILGQDDFSIQQHGEGDPRAFTTKPWWAQALVLAAGVAMNFVLALFVLTIAFMIGTKAATGVVRVDQIRAGFAGGDGRHPARRHRAHDRRPVDHAFRRPPDVRHGSAGRTRARSRSTSSATAGRSRRSRRTPRAEPPEDEGPLGIRLEDVRVRSRVALPQAFGQALGLSGDVVQQIAQLPGQLFAARGSGTGGPQVGGRSRSSS